MLVSGCQSQKSWYPWHRIRAQHWASLVAHLVKNPPAMHGKRSLAGCSPRDHKESDLSERLSTHTYMGSALEFFKTSPGDSNVQTILRTLTIQGVELQGTFYIIHFYSVWTFCQILHRCCCLVTKSFATPWTVSSLPGSSVHGISQARILGWLPLPSPGDLPDPRIKPMSPALADRFILTLSHQGSPNIILPWTLKKSELEEEWGGEGKRREKSGNGEVRKNRGRKHFLDLVDAALSFPIKFLEESTSSLSIHIWPSPAWLLCLFLPKAVLTITTRCKGPCLSSYLTDLWPMLQEVLGN